MTTTGAPAEGELRAEIERLRSLVASAAALLENAADVYRELLEHRACNEPFPVYIVTAGQYDGCWDEAAFSTRELAEQYIASVSKPRSRYDHVNPTVVEMPVHRSLVAEQYDDLPVDWPADMQSLPPRIVAASDSPPGAVGLGLVPPGLNPTDRGAE